MGIETQAEQEKYNHYIRWWFLTGAGLVMVMVVIGGITRLTGSGLSMTDWNLLMGAVPPLSESAWEKVFSQYKQFPEYQLLNSGMTLAEFKTIFFWEYLHRLTGRLIGLVFLLPFLWFWLKGRLTKKLLRRSLLLFLLGAAQGGMGWFMVKSGLVDVPAVSHYRLAVHLMLAFVIVGVCVWYGLDMKPRWERKLYLPTHQIGIWLGVFGLLLILQIVWGAFVAGLKAGYIYNTFPTMNGSWLPANFLVLKPALLNLVENPGTVQWLHRLTGTLLLVVAVITWRQGKQMGDRTFMLRLHLLLAFLGLQYGIGILTIIYNVPLAVGVLHQGMALLIWVAWIIAVHQISTQKKPKN